MLNLHDPIHVHRYILRSKAPLNAVSERREHEGAIVRIGDGVGCLHPWPELGDLPLDRQLSILEKGGFTGMIERLRVCCKLDGTARGGILVAIAEKLRLPIHAIGVGESIDDLQPFDAEAFSRAIAGLD